MIKVLHYELPNEPNKGLIRTFCGKLVTPKDLAQNQDEVNCLICSKELKKYNNSGQNI